MLGLKLPTDSRWAQLASNNLEEVLTDHAWCEQKAASNAISIIVSYSELPDLVAQLTNIAQEELLHFQQVTEKIAARNFVLGRERKDSYVNELVKYIRKGHIREIVLLDRLLFSAMIEARSCERFKMLTENCPDPDLAEFYRDLMVSEAGHYTTFLKLAKKHVNPEMVEPRWQEWLAYEAEVIQRYGKAETIHG